MFHGPIIWFLENCLLHMNNCKMGERKLFYNIGITLYESVFIGIKLFGSVFSELNCRHQFGGEPCLQRKSKSEQ